MWKIAFGRLETEEWAGEHVVVDANLKTSTVHYNGQSQQHHMMYWAVRIV
jgi:hypothetical protein